MMILLGPSAQESAERYSAILSGIAFDPTRFGELQPDDLAFCVDHCDGKLLWLTVQMDRLAHTDDEREAAIVRAMNADADVLARRTEIAMVRMKVGDRITLRDMAAWWVSECAIKTQMEVELERRAASLN